MEGNRDEAERCAGLAAEALNEGNLERAKKLAVKSEKLFPNALARKVLERVERAKSQQSESAGSSGQPRQRKTASKGSTEAKAPERKPHTPEQRELVQRVLRSKTLYEVLQIETTADENAIKKAYKLHALKIHPDKNPAPQAEEAFVRVSHAEAVLSDPERRARYDQHGEEREETVARRQTHRSGVYTQEVSPDELFEMFFGAAMPGARYQRAGGGFYQYGHGPRQRTARTARAEQRQAQESSRSSFLALLPLLIVMIGLVILNSHPDGYGEPKYSLHKHDKYRIPKRTMNAQVQYYVPLGFDKTIGSDKDLRRLENEVELAHAHKAYNTCQNEQIQLQRMQRAADSVFASRQVRDKYRREISAFSKPGCDELSRLRAIGVVR